MRGTAILEVKNVSKRFPGTQALAGVSLTLEAGSIHAVVGENGAGKSTLMNIVAGVYQPDEGTIMIGGTPVTIANPYAAQKLGVGFVHQEIALCQHLSVAENIFMSTINDARQPLREPQEVPRPGAGAPRRLRRQHRPLPAGYRRSASPSSRWWRSPRRFP